MRLRKMKKKTCLILIDRIFWAIILLLPILYWLFTPIGYSIGGGTALSGLSGNSINMVGFSDVLGNFGISTSSFIYGVLNDTFGENGVVPFFSSNSALILYFTYFISIEILHLLVDFLVFIPRLSHKWLNYLTRADEVD